MNLQPGTEDEPDINLTPLIDVVFLLLIFFMLASSFAQERALTLEVAELAMHIMEEIGGLEEGGSLVRLAYAEALHGAG